MSVKSFIWVAVPILGLGGCKKGESITVQAPGLSISSSGTHVNISADTDKMDDAVPSTGPVSTESRKVSAFHAIDADSIVEVKFAKGTTSSVSVEAKQSVLPHVKTEVEDGVLKMTLEGSFQDPGAVVVTITNPDLDSIKADGASKVECTGLSQSEVNVETDGSSMVTVDGSVAKLELAIAGSSNFSANALGECDLKVSAADSAGAKIAGKFTAADLDVEGSSHLDVDGLSARQATFKSDGGANVTASGTVATLTLECGGSSVMELQKLKAQSANATADGSAQVHLNVAKDLTAEANGASSVRYEGKPAVKSTLNGAGHVDAE